MPGSENVATEQVREEIVKLADKPEDLRNYLENIIPFLKGPEIKDFSPRKGYPGVIIEINGRNFSSSREENEVTVGKRRAVVFEASIDKLRAITDLKITSGPVEVKVGEKRAVGPFGFTVIDRPEEDTGGQTVAISGPPVVFTGCSLLEPGHVSPLGTLNILFILVSPSDRAPRNPMRSRERIIETRDSVQKFFNQASYGRLDLKIDVTKDWHTLTGKMKDYVDLPTEDIVCSSLDRLMAEAAQAAKEEGFNLDRYSTITCIINLNGAFVRGRGGWSCQNFQHRRGSLCIDITADHEINLVAIQESANWGRFAHEIGHGIVSRPRGLSAIQRAAVLSEDLYSTDLIDPAVATAQDFDMMGRHDRHPLFSAYYMDRLGWYKPENVLDLVWSLDGFSHEYEVTSHGLVENDRPDRYHIIRIKVSDGLYYYIEVRQRPGSGVKSDDQIFDDNLPINGTEDDGGVVVTKALAGRMHINQQMRFITLMHQPRVLTPGEVATDPERSLKVTVLKMIESKPLVCRVRVEWTKLDPSDPEGKFDLHIEPWNANWESPDIWIDRIPYDRYDEDLDDQGRPKGNGDKPRPMEVNHIWARVRCDGSVAAKDVRVTYYAVEPPNIGDNGNWAPIQTRIIPIIEPGSYVDAYINWVPVVGRHTAIKVWIEPQTGEITSGNNFAQENVLKFEAPASSKPKPVSAMVSICNPLDRRTLAIIKVLNVPDGYIVHFPYSWRWLEPGEACNCHLTIVPLREFGDYDCPEACIKVEGYIPQDYHADGSFIPGGRMVPLGGVQLKVCPKLKVKITLHEDVDVWPDIVIIGQIDPPMEGERVRIDLIDPDDMHRSHEMKTDECGRFAAFFELDVTTLDGERCKPAMGTLMDGIYTAKALMVNSPKGADCESEVIYLVR